MAVIANNNIILTMIALIASNGSLRQKLMKLYFQVMNNKGFYSKDLYQGLLEVYLSQCWIVEFNPTCEGVRHGKRRGHADIVRGNF